MGIGHYLTGTALILCTASTGCENKYQALQIKIYQDSLKIIKEENAQLHKDKENLLFLLSCFVEQNKDIKELEKLEKNEKFSKKKYYTEKESLKKELEEAIKK